MLSSQTKDQITAQAMTALKNHGLTIENIISTPEEEIARLIHPVGFWRVRQDINLPGYKLTVLLTEEGRLHQESCTDFAG